MSKYKIPMILAIVLLVTVACGLTNSLSSGAEQVATLANQAQDLATSAAGAVPQAALDDPQGYLVGVLRDRMMSEPFRGKATQVTTDQTIEFTVEYQPPDRFHMTMPGVLEGIIIDQTLYLNQGGGWLQVPLSADFMSGFGLLGPDNQELLDTIKDVSFEGAELLNGVPCLVFNYDSSAVVGGITSTSSSRLWLGATDGRVHQLVVTGEAAGVTSTTTIVYEYDPTIQVEKPVQ